MFSWLEIASAVLVAVLCLCCADDSARALPCPSAVDIDPCECTFTDDFLMTMDCSSVRDPDELADIFSTDFPVLDFHKLYFKYTSPSVFRVGDLGEATFQEIELFRADLWCFEEGAFSYSYDTLITMDLTDNVLNSSFPFHELTNFTTLRYLILDGNDKLLDGFPDIVSASLQNLHLNSMEIGDIHSSALQSLPELKAIELYSAGLTQLNPGTFVGLPNLNHVDVSSNDLTILKENTVELASTIENSFYASYNEITTVEVNAIKVLADWTKTDIRLNWNQLQELDEKVWRELFVSGVTLDASHNPLTCGCEMAWIVLDERFMNALSGDEQCDDGVLVSDLDPGIFEMICS